METYKILTCKEILNLKTFFQLSQPRLNSNLVPPVCWPAYMWEWSGDIIPLIPLLFCTLLSTALHKLTGSTTRITLTLRIVHCVLLFHRW